MILGICPIAKWGAKRVWTLLKLCEQNSCRYVLLLRLVYFLFYVSWHFLNEYDSRMNETTVDEYWTTFFGLRSITHDSAFGHKLSISLIIHCPIFLRYWSGASSSDRYFCPEIASILQRIIIHKSGIIGQHV